METLVANLSGRPAISRLPRLLVPSLSDCLFAAILIWVFAMGSGWTVLLADGDTGWHIRTGEYILDTRSVPVRDLFSFSKAGQEWFAWEWLADVVFAALHRFWGLKGVVAAAGVVLSLSATLLFRHMIWSGSNLLVALLTTLLAAGASTVHYLARPHIFTFLGLTVSLWVLDRDRRSPGRAVWWLVPLTALWTNLHGGFLGWIACLGLVVAGCAWKAVWSAPGDPARLVPVRRYGLLLLLCSAATLVNPYGYHLHRHIFRYLSSDWIRQAVDEFQSPRFRSESMLQFEILLFAGLAMLPVLFRGRRLPEILMVLFWGHSALVSARHIPVYVIAAAPVCALEVSRLWSGWSASFGRRSVVGTLRDAVRDLSAVEQRTSLIAPVLVAGLFCIGWNWPRDFPENKFPVVAVERGLDSIAPALEKGPRILTSDQWGDYLIYRFYPRGQVFVDGRSDFYGPSVGREYLALMNGAPGWEQIVNRYAFDIALIPLEWPLGQLLMHSAGWRVRFIDRQAVLLERPRDSSVNKKPDSTERTGRD